MPISAQSNDDREQFFAGQSDTLTNMLPRDASIETYLSHKQVRPACPRCGGDTLVRNGKRAGRQRFRCVKCGKTLGYSNGTPFYRSKQPFKKWKGFIACVEKRTPLREIAEQCDISTHTACKWRQRYLDVKLRGLLEILEEMKAKGMIRTEADLESVAANIEQEMNRTYRGRSRKKVLARLERAKEKFGMRLIQFNNRFLREQARHQPLPSNPLYGTIPAFNEIMQSRENHPP